jgi:hypothetical protein
MSAFTDFLINTLSSSLETIGESKLDELLQTLHDKHPDQYEAAIFGGVALVNALLPLTKTSATKIDDAIVQALDEALKASATANQLVLP